MQRVAEFMEQRARLVERQQRRLAGAGLGEIHDVVDDRLRALAQPVAELSELIHAPDRFEAAAK